MQTKPILFKVKHKKNRQIVTDIQFFTAQPVLVPGANVTSSSMVLPYLCSPSNKASWLGVVVSLLVAFLGKLHVFGKDNIGGGQSAQIFFFFLGWLFLGKKDTVVVAVEDFFGDLSFQAFGSAAALVAVVQQVPKGLSDTFAGRVVPNLEPLLSVLVKLDKATPGALAAHQPHHIRDDGRLLGAAAHAAAKRWRPLPGIACFQRGWRRNLPCHTPHRRHRDRNPSEDTASTFDGWSLWTIP